MTSDWVSPAWDMIQGLAKGPARSFAIPADAGYSGAEVEAYLRGHAIETWGAMEVEGYLLLRVPRGQGPLAEFWLRRAAIPFE